MKVGILTHYDVNNQGAQLQMTAMAKKLESMGHEVRILTYKKNFDYNGDEELRNQVSLRSVPYYIKHYLLEKGLPLTWFNTRKVLKNRRARRRFTYAPYDSSGCDAVIIGSDEVFSVDVGCNRMMYGHGIGVPAIAYAPSFGMTNVDVLNERGCFDDVQGGLRSMYRLSARDAHTREMIRILTGRDVPMVCDPVLLYEGEYTSPKRQIKRPYMLIYAYDSNMTAAHEAEAIKAYAKKHGLMTISAGTYHKWCDKNIACNAEEWYGYFKNAACVVTDTFHGTIASVCSNSNVAVFVRTKLNLNKLTSLLLELNMEDRRINEFTEDELERILSAKIDYAAVNEKRSAMAKAGENYLKWALEGINEE